MPTFRRLFVTVNHPDEPHGVPIFDGAPERVAASLADGTYAAVWSGRLDDGTEADHAGIVTIANGRARFTCYDAAPSNSECGCRANGLPHDHGTV